MAKRERGGRKSPPSLVVWVAYIECATPSPPMLQSGGVNAITQPTTKMMLQVPCQLLVFAYPSEIRCSEWNELVEWSAMLRVVVVVRVTWWSSEWIVCLYEIYLDPHVVCNQCFMIFQPFVGLPVMCIPNSRGISPSKRHDRLLI